MKAPIIQVILFLFSLSFTVRGAEDPDSKIPIMPQVLQVQKLVKKGVSEGNLTEGQGKSFQAELDALARVLKTGDKDEPRKIGMHSVGPIVGAKIEDIEARVRRSIDAGMKKSK